MRVSLYSMLLIAGALSVPFLGGYGPLPTTALLDGWIVLLLITLVVRGRTEAHLIMLLLAIYLLSRVVLVLYTESPLYDAAQAYRWVLYLIVMATVVGRQWGPIRPLIGVTWALLGLALVKSAATFALYGGGERPGLLLENNFELALFSGLVAVLYRHMSSRERLGVLAVLGAVVALSGSRSGAVSFVVLAVYATTKMTRANALTRYVILLALGGLGAAAYWVFDQRAAVVSRVDRLNFLDVFLAETQHWSPLTWVFGTTPITRLSSGGCQRLGYYETLFSSVGDGTCFSVILHSFVLRVVFDSGLLGLALSIFVPLYLMRKAGVDRALGLSLVAISVANGLSVSGLNNPYVALPIMLAIATASRSELPPLSVVSIPTDSGRSTPRAYK